jgi:hypothetical protein
MATLPQTWFSCAPTHNTRRGKGTSRKAGIRAGHRIDQFAECPAEAGDLRKYGFLGSLTLCVNCFDSRLVPQLLQLCEERASPAFDSLSRLLENFVSARWHCGNLGFSRRGFCDSQFC